VAGAVSETFGDNGGVGGDTVDFTNVATSQGVPLTINVSGHPVLGAADTSTAVVGAVTYTFCPLGPPLQCGPSSGPSPGNFTRFIGASSGSTRFDAPGSTTLGHGYTFNGSGPSNTADFSAVSAAADGSGITANMLTGQVTSLNFATPDQLLGSFTHPGSDTVVGSASGSNTFLGNLNGTNFTAQNPAGSSNTVSYADLISASGVTFKLNSDQISALPAAPGSFPDKYSFGPASLVAEGSPGSDAFILGQSAATLEGGGGQDALDLSQLLTSGSGSTGASVDLDGGSVTGAGIPDPGIVFTPGCNGASALCVTSVKGSKFDDTYTLNAHAIDGTVPPVQVTGNGGNDTLDLSRIANSPANLCMPISGISPLGAPFPCTGNGGGIVSPRLTDILSSPTGTAPISSLPVSATSDAVSSGDQITVSSGSTSQTFIAAAFVPAGATSIPVVTVSPTINFPAGSTVSDVTFTPDIKFSGIASVFGTLTGGDYVYAGTGTATFTEAGPALGTLDFSNVPGTANPSNATAASGVAVTVSNPGGIQQGSVKGSSPLVRINDSFFGFGTFVGSQGNDSFTQSGPGTYSFEGGFGRNSLDLSGVTDTSGLPFGATIAVQASTGACSVSTLTNTDGMAVPTSASNPASDLSDTFSCISSLSAPAGSTFLASASSLPAPSPTATLVGGGSGILDLVNDTIGLGATINLATGLVTGDGYNFHFSGMTSVSGTPYNDTFVPGSTSVTVNGNGGQDGLTYAGDTAAADVNLSNSAFTVPAGMPNANTTVPPCTAIGGNGGTVSMPGCTISDVTGTSNPVFADVLIGGSGVGTLTGGAGSDRFVITNGGQTTIVGGTGSSTLDLSQLSGFATFSLGDSTVQPLPSGSVQVASGNINEVIASQGGSYLTAGFGNATLIGGPGNDVLAAGTALSGQTQTLIGGSGRDTLVGGIGTDLLEGGSKQPTIFQPGQGSEVLTSPVPGNTLQYIGATQGIQVNLSSQPVTVPPGEPFAGTALQPQTVTGGFPGSSVDLTGASITTVVGTPRNDLFVVTGNNLNVRGGGGADMFLMGSGSNTVSEPSGASPTFLFQAGGSNTINGGGNGTVDFSQAPARVIVNLQNHTAVGGFGGTQILNGIKSVIGTNHNFSDILIAGPPGGVIKGNGTGRDLLQAGPSGGDTLIGGNGNTTFCSAASCAVPGTSSAGGATVAAENKMFGGLGEDSFFVRNGGHDAIDGGGGFFNIAQIDGGGLDSAVRIQLFLK
jgi:Ca2+-binding RTX toxin-like protein